MFSKIVKSLRNEAIRKAIESLLNAVDSDNIDINNI